MSGRNEVDAAPLTEATFLILLAIGEQPRHGYAIMQEVESLSDGRVRLSTGTLYGALKRVLDTGWIRRLKGETKDAREKQTYELTKSGRRALVTETERLENLSRISRVRLQGVKA